MKTLHPLALHDDPVLSITRLPGTSDMLVVAFAGIGTGTGGIAPEEFIGTASQGMRNHVAFVIDKDRSWYSAPGIQDRILSVLNGLIAAQGIRKVVCLGNSMGGHGALLFARRLGAEVAIAFVPQFSMDPAIVDERRWSQFRPFIRLEGLGNLNDEIVPEVRNHVFFGTDNLPDHRHMGPFLNNPAVKFHLLRGCGHDASQHLKTARKLSTAITAMMAKDDAALAESLAGHLTDFARP